MKNRWKEIGTWAIIPGNTVTCYSRIHTINQLKYWLRLCTTGNIALGHNVRANIALIFALWYISLWTTPLCYIPILHLLYYFNCIALPMVYVK